MSICERHRIEVDDWVAGIGNLDTLDLDHCRDCPDCAALVAEARLLKRWLESWSAAVETEARSAADLPLIHRGRRLFVHRRAAAWLAAAAAVALFWLMAPYLLQRQYVPSPQPPSPVLGEYFASVETTATREDLLAFLSRSQLFLLELLDQSRCRPEDSATREAADRLIRQKRQLEARLADDSFADVQPVLEELEMLLLVVSERGGCLGEDDGGRWRQLIQSRSTLLRINLLQMEDRL
jgi:hypothetical protein